MILWKNIQKKEPLIKEHPIYNGSCAVVYNACYGGFDVSDVAYERIRERKNINPTKFEEEYQYKLSGIPRDDEDLVEVVRELGDQANGKCAKLKISEKNPKEFWEIDEYDGSEYVTMDYRKILNEMSNILKSSKSAEKQTEEMKALFDYLEQFPHFRL